ncbi:hypothetical protein TSMG0056 [Halocynthia phage JM-2012]|uniref:hypothetical protein n=1 Tax=Halocynthia phage JM-2012 TaxID=1173297 RepID=UPI00025C690C|nr:hypothetical protein TSMG0056 [Halocynthia phage JM-2012]AFI55339.1 hypothetical protein TSMG0056 [Halocynthia phage JM-2012]
MIYLSLNLSGSNEDNLITKDYPIRFGLATNEGQVIVPEYGVFLTEGLVVTHKDTNTPLTLNVDYYLTYYSHHLKANYDLDGFAGIVLVNKTLTGTLSLTTPYVGGGYTTFNPTAVKEVVELINGVPVELTWDNVVDAPAASNPNTHNLPADKIATGFQDYVAVLWEVGKKLSEVADKADSTKIPIGTEITTVVPNNSLNMNYWVESNGQTITRDDYPAFFLTLAIVGDSFVLTDKSNTYVRVK